MASVVAGLGAPLTGTKYRKTGDGLDSTWDVYYPSVR